MPFQYPLPGGNNVAEYQASALPWVTGSVALTGSVTRHDFPTVTSWINIQNTSASGVLEVGATQYGTLFETNVFQIPAGGSWYAPYRLVSLYTMAASGSVSQTYQINAGLTGIARRDYPRVEDAVPSGVGSDSFTPLSISGCLCWFDTSILSSLWQDDARTLRVTAASQPIAVMDDLSLQDRPQKQTGSGQRPTYVLTSGIPGASFDGVDDFVQTDVFSWGSGQSYDYWVIFTPASNAITLKIIAAKQTTIYTEADATIIYSYRAAGSPPQCWSYRSNLLWDIGGGLLGSGQRRVCRFSLDNATSPDTMINMLDGVNGTSFLTPHATNSTSTNGTARFRLGSSSASPWDGVIHEAVAFSRALTSLEASQLQAYFKAKWGTP